MKKFIFTLLIATTTFAVQAKDAKQVGLMSDYLFRGITRTDNSLAVYVNGTKAIGNAYVGLHFINIEPVDDAEGVAVEMDVNFGYNFKFDHSNIDFEVITYNYLLDAVEDETEFKIGTTLTKGVNVNLYRGIKQNTWYPELTYEKYLKYHLYLDVAVGVWLPDNADDSALTFRTELGRDFPEFYNIDIYGAVDYISDSTPFGNESDDDDAETEFVVGIRKNF